MARFETRVLPASRDAVARDGSDVRVLAGLTGASMAHFQLGPNRTWRAIVHRTVDELWYVVAGRGQMWREQDGDAEIIDLFPGVSLTLPQGTRFQFRSTGHEPLAAVGVTIPPWPGDDEAMVVAGAWKAELAD